MNTANNFLSHKQFNLAAMTNEKQLSESGNLCPRKIVVMDKQECIFIKVGNLSYAEANGAYTNVYLSNGEKILVCKNLKAFSEKLPESEFIRVHKSFIININFISKYVKSEGGYLIMENGKQIPVSSRKKDLIVNLIEQLVL